MTWDGSVRFAVTSPNTVADEFDGEVVIVNLLTGTYFSTTGTAALVWRLVMAHASIDEIVQALGTLKGSLDHDVSADVYAFLRQLDEGGLIVRAGVSEMTTPQVDAALAYTAPALEVYSDLQDILLLDPVHDVNAEGWPIARGPADPPGA